MERFDQHDGLTSDFSLAMVDEGMGDLWVATGLGLDRFRHRPRFMMLLAGVFGVGALLHGIVRRTCLGLRLTIELANATGFLVSSQRYDIRDGDCGVFPASATIWSRRRSARQRGLGSLAPYRGFGPDRAETSAP